MATSASFTDGVALHDYAGDPAAIADVSAHFPEQDMVFTEKTLWGVAGVDRVAEYFRNGSTSYVAWVTMLDQHGLPNSGPNFEKPRRFVRSLDGDDYWATPEHFLFGLYSRFVLPGARRIASDYGDPSTVTDVAFANPDGMIAVIVANQTDVTQEFTLRTQASDVRASLPAHTAAAYAWQGLGASTALPWLTPPILTLRGSITFARCFDLDVPRRSRRSAAPRDQRRRCSRERDSCA